MIIVADASPLIFLGKLNRLELIVNLFGSDILVPQKVVDEVLLQPILAREELILREFFSSSCQIVQVKDSQFFVTAMSSADSEVMTLAIRRKADFMLVDDRIVREVAVIEGVRPMGTLGVILRAVNENYISVVDAYDYFYELVRKHKFRVSVDVYDAVLNKLKAIENH